MKIAPEEIKSIRESLDWSRANLADILGVHYATVSKWETGKLEPGIYHQVLMQAFSSAAENDPEIGDKAIMTKEMSGIPTALHTILGASLRQQL